MFIAADPPSLATVSHRFLEDWLEALRAICPAPQMQAFLAHAGLAPGPAPPGARVTLDQIVRLYQIAAVDSGDEMMGLWGRPVRARALQHLLTTVRAAGSLPAALHRFSTFWNLLLDDFRLDLHRSPDRLELSVHPRHGQARVQRFGQMLILKLAHGLLSWLAGHEVAVSAVQFSFARPDFAADYAVIFPAPVQFGADYAAIVFDPRRLGPPVPRSKAELTEFLRRAPRDWMFTGSRDHAQALRVREFLYRAHWQGCGLAEAAEALKLAPRTLMRRLDAEGVSFQAIKDGLRRDIAIRDLRAGKKPIEQIAQELGFSSAANFHRAFRRWTGATPGAFRRAGGAAGAGDLARS
jgi:AraC-like DNA-binding protein